MNDESWHVFWTVSLLPGELMAPDDSFFPQYSTQVRSLTATVEGTPSLLLCSPAWDSIEQLMAHVAISTTNPLPTAPSQER